MSIIESNELAEVLNRVRGWSARLRIALAKEILDSLQSSIVAAGPNGQADLGLTGVGGLDAPRRSPRGVSAEEIQGLLKTDRPAPDDETVKRWIDEHRMEKYG